MILNLQSNTDFIEGDISYKHAYYNRLYEQGKARFMEAASNAEIQEVMGPIASGILPDSLNENWEGVAERRLQLAKLQAVLDSEEDYFLAEIGIADMCSAMIYNAVFDEINMNTFNFVNASFDNLFFRFPTDAEFYAGFNMIEYIDILANSHEFYEGLIIWTYQVLLAREPSTLETNQLMIDLWVDHDLQKVQRSIMITDEYAHFE
jgi:hypothetical protein